MQTSPVSTNRNCHEPRDSRSGLIHDCGTSVGGGDLELTDDSVTIPVVAHSAWRFVGGDGGLPGLV